MKRALLIVPILLISFTFSAQDLFPSDGILFNSSSVSRIDISIDQADLDQILLEGNEKSDIEYMATFKFTRGTFTTTIDSVGFRLRGNTSRYSAKKSFKVSLNTFIPGQKFQGVEKLNLNGEHNDPSISRAALSWDLFREAAVPGSRAGHTEFYINGVYKGLYINVEHVDEEFVDLRYGFRNGNLYKCLYPADLNYRGSDPEDYQFEKDGRLVYELKTDPESDDYEDIAELARILKYSGSNSFRADLEAVFNVNAYLKNLVVEILIGHWDAYSFNKNNYYLYHNDGTGKLEFIPYDPDNTFGIDWFNIDWANRNIYSWGNERDGRPLSEEILDIPVYRDRFSFYMKRFLENSFNSATLDAKINELSELLKEYVEPDQYRSMDYGYSYNDFLNAFNSAAGDHVKYGIKPYIASRMASAEAQLSVTEIDPIITFALCNKPELSEALELGVYFEDEAALYEKKAWFSQGGEFAERPMKQIEGDFYQIIYPGLSEPGVVKFFFEATDQNMNTTRDPIQGYYRVGYGITTSVVAGIEGPEFSVYPNPASDIIFVSLDENYLSAELKLIDLGGRVVQHGKVISAEQSIDISALTSGIYLLELKLNTSEGPFLSRKKILVK